MVAVPIAVPETMPISDTVAIPVKLLLHAPALVPSVNVVVPPTQIFRGPFIVPGNGLMVTGVVLMHPVESSV